MVKCQLFNQILEKKEFTRDILGMESSKDKIAKFNMYRNQLNILEHFTTAKKMVKANIITEMVEHGKENGRKIDNMDLESSKIKRVFK